MTDRFGVIPTIVIRLLLAATLRYYVSYALFERLIIQRKNIIIILPKGEKEDYYKYQFVELMRFILREYKNQIKLEQKKDTMKLLIINNYSSPEELLLFLIEFCNQVAKLFTSKAVIEKEQTN
jgi:transcription-repair coupling factor (superfamily II helicase)